MAVAPLFVLLIGFGTGPPATARAECLGYEPADVSLTGKIVSRTYPGPPNYESIAGGDSAETAIILVLAEPICVAGHPARELNSEGFSEVRELQLVPSGQDLRGLLGRRAEVRGTLFSGHTAHHRTRVLLSVTSLSAA